MSETTAARSFVLERDIPLPPEKVWRALTQPALIEQWLMPNDFQAMVGRAFQFQLPPTEYWNGIVDSEVLSMEPQRRLSYSWNTSGANALATVVTWSLSPTGGGTHLRLEQTGFAPEQEALYQGAVYGWQKFVPELQRVAAEL